MGKNKVSKIRRKKVIKRSLKKYKTKRRNIKKNTKNKKRNINIKRNTKNKRRMRGGSKRKAFVKIYDNNNGIESWSGLELTVEENTPLHENYTTMFAGKNKGFMSETMKKLVQKNGDEMNSTGLADVLHSVAKKAEIRYLPHSELGFDDDRLRIDNWDSLNKLESTHNFEELGINSDHIPVFVVKPIESVE